MNIQRLPVHHCHIKNYKRQFSGLNGHRTFLRVPESGKAICIRIGSWIVDEETVKVKTRRGLRWLKMTKSYAQVEIREFEELLESFEMIPNPYQFPGNRTWKIHFKTLAQAYGWVDIPCLPPTQIEKLIKTFYIPGINLNFLK